MRVLVCGGRDYKDRREVYELLSCIHQDDPISRIIQGGALGADRFAADWARCAGVRVEEYKADWERHGKAAGPIRNGQMIRDGRPHLVLAFPGGAGTANMIKQAKAAGIEVIEQ